MNERRATEIMQFVLFFLCAVASSISIANIAMATHFINKNFWTMRSNKTEWNSNGRQTNSMEFSDECENAAKIPSVCQNQYVRCVLFRSAHCALFLILLALIEGILIPWDLQWMAMQIASVNSGFVPFCMRSAR